MRSQADGRARVGGQARGRAGSQARGWAGSQARGGTPQSTVSAPPSSASASAQREGTESVAGPSPPTRSPPPPPAPTLQAVLKSPGARALGSGNAASSLPRAGAASPGARHLGRGRGARARAGCHSPAFRARACRWLPPAPDGNRRASQGNIAIIRGGIKRSSGPPGVRVPHQIMCSGGRAGEAGSASGGRWIRPGAAGVTE